MTASIKVTRLNKFAANEDHNFEGDSAFDLTLAATPIGAGARLKDGTEWWCADGGWVSAFWQQNTANPWGFGPTISTPATRTWTADDVYDPIEHIIFLARVSDPSGAQPDEWVMTQAPVAVDANTQFNETIERSPSLASPPQLSLPIDPVHEPVFLAVRGPVEAYDLLVPSGNGLTRTRTLVLAGQVVNWFKDPKVLEAITKPPATGPINLKVSVEDHTAGRMVVSESCFNSATRKWERNLGQGEGNGFTMQQDDRVAAFLMHIAVPETFSFGILVLEFVWRGGGVKRSIPIRAGDPDILHLPVKLADGESIRFGNGLSPNFNSHTSDLHQHLAYDIISMRADGANTSLGTGLLAVATGSVRGHHDSEPDRASGVGGSGVANRLFMEHTHVEGRRYSVFAHIKQHSATHSTAITAGGDIAQMGNNGNASGEHLHLAYYRLNRFGRMRMLPMAFALRKGLGSETIVGVPADGLVAIPGVETDPIVTKLEVHLKTGNAPGAGTDDDVSILIGGRTFNLDDPNRNDFEAGHTDIFSITPWEGLRLSMLRGRLRIRKSPDSTPTSQWLLQGVKIVANGSIIFEKQGLNRWLGSLPGFSLDWTDTI
jgi:hypothetical protein